MGLWLRIQALSAAFIPGVGFIFIIGCEKYFFLRNIGDFHIQSHSVI